MTHIKHHSKPRTDLFQRTPQKPGTEDPEPSMITMSQVQTEIMSIELDIEKSKKSRELSIDDMKRQIKKDSFSEIDKMLNLGRTMQPIHLEGNRESGTKRRRTTLKEGQGRKTIMVEDFGLGDTDDKNRFSLSVLGKDERFSLGVSGKNSLTKNPNNNGKIKSFVMNMNINCELKIFKI